MLKALLWWQVGADGCQAVGELFLDFLQKLSKIYFNLIFNNRIHQVIKLLDVLLKGIEALLNGGFWLFIGCSQLIYIADYEDQILLCHFYGNILNLVHFFCWAFAFCRFLYYLRLSRFFYYASSYVFYSFFAELIHFAHWQVHYY